MSNNINTKSLQLLSRYSLPPNSLGYCGKNSATEKFKECIRHGICNTVDEELTHFIVLHPYLKTIAEISDKNKFDYEVGECFWLGNDLIKLATVEHYELLLQNLQTQGVPESFVQELLQKQPKQFLPFHLFQVLHVGVGKSSGAVPFNLDTINNCMIRWGKVSEIEGTTLKAEMNSLKLLGSKYVFTKIPVEAQFDPLILRNLKIGDTISMHWKVANNILNDREIANLEYWSNKVLDNLVY